MSSQGSDDPKAGMLGAPVPRAMATSWKAVRQRFSTGTGSVSSHGPSIRTASFAQTPSLRPLHEGSQNPKPQTVKRGPRFRVLGPPKIFSRGSLCRVVKPKSSVSLNLAMHRKPRYKARARAPILWNFKQNSEALVVVSVRVVPVNVVVDIVDVSVNVPVYVDVACTSMAPLVPKHKDTAVRNTHENLARTKLSSAPR